MICLTVLAVPAGAQRSSVDEPVRVTFTAFKHALLSRDGARAAGFIDDETAALYEQMRRAALEAPKAELLKSTLFFQVVVLTVRQNLTKDEIQNISGRDLYGKTVVLGGLSASMGVEALSVVKVFPGPDGHSAMADLGLDGRPEMFRIKLLNQKGRWRVYLMDLIKIGSDEFQARFGVFPTTSPAAVERVVVQYLFPAIVEQSGQPISPAIWTPLAQRQ